MAIQRLAFSFFVLCAILAFCFAAQARELAIPAKLRFAPAPPDHGMELQAATAAIAGSNGLP
jgi:hypothetical protein